MPQSTRRKGGKKALLTLKRSNDLSKRLTLAPLLKMSKRSALAAALTDRAVLTSTQAPGAVITADESDESVIPAVPFTATVADASKDKVIEDWTTPSNASIPMTSSGMR